MSSDASAALRLLALRVLFGARNGALYGVKVRAPHAVVLTALWHDGDAATKAAAVAHAVATHSAQLCGYATLYKALFYALGAGAGTPARANGCGRGGGSTNAPLRAGVAGFLAGSLLFRHSTPVNAQIILFLFSRAAVGAAKKLSAQAPAALRRRAWPLFAGATWAAVMALYELDKSVLATGLTASMDFIYRDAEEGELQTWAELVSPRAWREALAHR
jgi:peroxisomal membrane protein 4